ncbi:MAG: carbon storage regulator CsrA [Acidobacteria bacterium]|nr:carbon storage regulator CsrA [Acidobacteriota bacterium]
MLVLTRKIGQSLIIGKDIRVKVIDIRGQQVRLGLEAPDDVPVVREELHRAVVAANREAARTDRGSLDAIVSTLRKPEPPEGNDNP